MSASLSTSRLSPSHVPPADDHTAEEEEAHPPPLPPVPPFQPFFSLLTTHSFPSYAATSTNTTIHHPNVRYIFASDHVPTPLDSALQDPASQESERYIVINLDATGKRVVSAQSLSSEWAVTKAEVKKAPTWGESGDGYGREGKQRATRQRPSKGDEDAGTFKEEPGMMLVIEGVESPELRSNDQDEDKSIHNTRRDDEGDWGSAKEIEALVEDFSRGMHDLRSVVSSLQVTSNHPLDLEG